MIDPYLFQDIQECLYINQHKLNYSKVVDEYMTKFVYYVARIPPTRYDIIEHYITLSEYIKNDGCLPGYNIYDDILRRWDGKYSTPINYRTPHIVRDGITLVNEVEPEYRIYTFHFSLFAGSNLPRNYWFTYPDKKSLRNVL